MGISILPPDINEGESGFSVSGDAIRYGLSAIKSVGRSVVNEIIREREENGLFRTMEEFVGRMTNKEVNKRTLENFIKSGALDSSSRKPQTEIICGTGNAGTEKQREKDVYGRSDDHV